MKSMDTGLRILALFKDSERPLGVVEIAARLGLGKSHVSRLLAAMRSAGFVCQDPETRKYCVGIEAFALGMRFVADQSLTRLALPVMRGSAEATGHSVVLSIRHGLACRHILAVEGRSFPDFQWRLGVRLPLHASAAGKLWVAFAAPAERADLIAHAPLERYTDATVTDRAAFGAAVATARAEGWAMARGETVPGLGACAVPVFGPGEAMVAAFGVVAPLAQLPADPEALVSGLARDARRLSGQLGARSYPVDGANDRVA
ncbi:MAG: IclR family transcriptional regulator [Alkalilacustris sp.]